MFERFTERARMVVVLAQEEARALRHNYIGTEHLLLGMIREEEGTAARVLESVGLGYGPARDDIEHIVGPGENVTGGQIPFTPRAKKSLEMALREALSLGHDYIGTEHLLLGLIRDENGVAVRVLSDFGVPADRVRDEVLRQLKEAPPPQPVRSRGIRFKPPWFGPAAELVDQLAPEIRQKHGREPDAGDLLIVLASAYGVENLDDVQAAVDRSRAAEATKREDAIAQARRRLGLDGP